MNFKKYLLLILTILPIGINAQSNYPTRPIRIVIPQTPGSATDALIRLIAPKLSEQLGQAIVLDNVAGAGGVIGAEMAAKATPDGYTLLMGATSWITIAPNLNSKITYTPTQKLSAISTFAFGQNVLLVSANSEINNVADLIAKMKAQPNKMNMASAGIGSTSHIAGVLLTALSNSESLHIPYKGTGPATVSLMAGESQWLFTPLQGPMALIRSGKLKALAVGGGTRSVFLPDVPTIKESGITNYDLKNWYGLLAPAGTPMPIIQKVHDAIVNALNNPELQKQLLAQGAEMKTMTPEEFTNFIRDETQKMAFIIKTAGIVQE